MIRTIQTTPAKAAPDALPAYYTPDHNLRALRVLTELEQMYGYYSAE